MPGGAPGGTVLGVGLMRSGPFEQCAVRSATVRHALQTIVNGVKAREAIKKVCTLPLLFGESLGHGFAQPSRHSQARNASRRSAVRVNTSRRA